MGCRWSEVQILSPRPFSFCRPEFSHGPDPSAQFPVSAGRRGHRGVHPAARRPAAGGLLGGGAGDSFPRPVCAPDPAALEPAIAGCGCRTPRGAGRRGGAGAAAGMGGGARIQRVLRRRRRGRAGPRCGPGYGRRLAALGARDPGQLRPGLREAAFRADFDGGQRRPFRCNRPGGRRSRRAEAASAARGDAVPVVFLPARRQKARRYAGAHPAAGRRARIRTAWSVRDRVQG